MTWEDNVIRLDGELAERIRARRAVLNAADWFRLATIAFQPLALASFAVLRCWEISFGGGRRT